MPEVYSRKSDTSDITQRSSVLKSATPRKTSLSAFCLLPLNLQFDVQHDNEQILLFMRQHFITQTKWIVACVFLALLPTLLPIFNFFSFLPVSFQLVIHLTWYLVIAGYAIESFIVWYYNVYIITNERIIDVDFFSLLFKRVSEARLDRIEDITSASGGVLQSFFDFGDVTVQTAAEIPEIEFEQVPHPDLVEKLVGELTDTTKRKK